MTVELTMALERYDRHVPFFMDMVAPPDGIKIKSLEVGMAPPRREGIDRHRRFYEDEEFDICEMSVSSYLTSKAQGLPYTAVPVFPRRLFSQNHLFVSTAANISNPNRSDRQESLLPQFPDHHVRIGQGRSRVRIWRALARTGLAYDEPGACRFPRSERS